MKKISQVKALELFNSGKSPYSRKTDITYNACMHIDSDLYGSTSYIDSEKNTWTVYSFKKDRVIIGENIALPNVKTLTDGMAKIVVAMEACEQCKEDNGKLYCRTNCRLFRTINI